MSVRRWFVRSLLHSSPDRALHSGDGEGGQTTRVLSNACLRLTIYVYPRYSPLPAHAVPRDDPVFLSSGRRRPTRTEDSSTRQPHAPRGAHTQRPNAFCNGDLWRETAEGPHGAPWITPPPGVRNVATRLGHGRSFLHRRRRRTFPSFLPSFTRKARTLRDDDHQR